MSQNKIPGSADFHALCVILSHNFLELIAFVKDGFLEFIGYCCLYGLLSTTDCINSSSILTEIFAPVILPASNFASIKSSASGCFEEIDNIKAPLLPSCATSLVELE